MIKSLKNKVIVSVQAMPDEPLYKEECMFSMMQSVINGGASALRVAGARDVKNAKKLGVPVIGLTKPDGLPENWKEIVYITPTIKETDELINADADIIAFDGTSRPRPNKCTLEAIIARVKSAGRYAMADIATLEEGLNCAELGVDIISTTLSGYTQESLSDSDEPDYELLKALVKNTSVPVILEGRIWNPEQVDKAFEYGAHSVVIGSAITRPQLITKRFIER
ncbi:MAG: N-acetylmannosamine-6-phosphate 2-epimerase [Candidatus Gastranaerophilales bacterium]|nr:N-acetylmannosamine-6-phosphate 2-epimerase [Candidatus Gastranaerophilales bacterium]